MSENNQPVDNSQDNNQNTVDNSQENNQPVDNSQDNNQNPVDNSQENNHPVDNSPQNNTTDLNGNKFDAQKYLESLEPEKQEPDLQQLQQENSLLKEQRDALKDAYLKLKANGITLVSNPESQAKKTDPNTEADAMLKRWMHS